MNGFSALLLLASFFCGLNSASAESVYLVEEIVQEEQQVPDELPILGRGVQDHRKESTIALACVGEADQVCKKLRHVLFSAGMKEASFLGPIYHVYAEGQEPTEDEIKRVTKKIGKEFKGYRKEKNYWIHAGIILVSAAATAGISLYFWTATYLTDMAYVFFTANFMTIGIGAEFLNSSGSVSSGDVSKAIRNQDGWNWSVEPKQITHFKFRQYEEFLKLQGKS